MGNKTNTKPALFLHFPSSTLLLHCRPLYLLLVSPNQCRVRDGGVAVSPEHFISATPSSSHFFPVPAEALSTGDSPLAKIWCSVGPPWDTAPSGNVPPWAMWIHSLSLSCFSSCGFGISSVSYFLFTLPLSLGCFSPINTFSERCHACVGCVSCSCMCPVVGLFWSWPEPPVLTQGSPWPPPTEATPAVPNRHLLTPMKTAVDYSDLC